MTNEELPAYCTTNPIARIRGGTYQDWLFPFNHDAALAVLSKYQHGISMPAALGREERKKVITENEGLETELYDILYQEIDIETHNLGGAFQPIVISVGKSVNELTMFSFIAESEYHDPKHIGIMRKINFQHRVS